IGADLAALKRIVKPLMWVRGQDANIDPIFAEIEQTLRREADYTKEADYLEKYREYTEQLTGFIVPKVYRSHSTKRILVLSFESGMRLKDWMKTVPSQEERDQFAAKVLELIFHEFFVWGFVQT